jgi:hypothetical protein
MRFADLQSLVNPIIGQADATHLDASEVVNHAGNWLFHAHDWPWRERPEVLLPLTASQNWVDLPRDFASLISLSMEDGIVSVVEMVGPHSLAMGRSSRGTGHTTQVYWVRIQEPPQESPGQEPRGPRLEMYPTPPSTVENAFRLVYRAKWVWLTEGTDVPNIPPDMHPCLSQLVREYARGEMAGDLGQRLVAFMQNPVFTQAKRTYGIRNKTMGMMQGGHTQTRRLRPFWDPNVSAPSST